MNVGPKLGVGGGGAVLGLMSFIKNVVPCLFLPGHHLQLEETDLGVPDDRGAEWAACWGRCTPASEKFLNICIVR